MREQPWRPLAAALCLVCGLVLAGSRPALAQEAEIASARGKAAVAELPARVPVTQSVYYRCAAQPEVQWVRTQSQSARQLSDMTKEELMRPGPWEFAAYATGYYIPNAGFSGKDGHVNTGIGWLRLKIAKRVGMGGWVQFDGVYEYRQYAFDKLQRALPPFVRHPDDHVNGIGFRVRYLQAFSEKWGAFVFGRMRSDAEQGAKLGESITWIGTLGIGHMFPNKLLLGVGAALVAWPEEDPFVIPAVQFTWPISKRWYAELDGSTLKVEYSLSPCWTLALAGYYEAPRIRLDDDAIGRNGLLTDERLPVELRATWTPRGGNVDLQLRVGADLYRELEFADSQRMWIRTLSLDPTPFVGFRLKITF